MRLTGIDVGQFGVAAEYTRPGVTLEPVIVDVEGVRGVGERRVGQVAVAAGSYGVAVRLARTTCPINPLKPKQSPQTKSHFHIVETKTHLHNIYTM